MADQFPSGEKKGGLTPFAKILIGLIIIGAVGYVAYTYLPEIGGALRVGGGRENEALVVL